MRYKVRMVAHVAFEATIEAESQTAALEEADKIDLRKALEGLLDQAAVVGPVAYDPVSQRFIDRIETEDAIAYYLVDEPGDRRHEYSQYYDDLHRPFSLNVPPGDLVAVLAASLTRTLDRKLRRANPYQQPKTTSDAG